MPNNQLREDAVEMVKLVQEARCFARYGVISLDKAAEILTAFVVEGEVSPRNTLGYDVTSHQFGKIEVKSRTLGTDGQWPRVTVTRNKLEVADWFMAVRWTPERSVYAAIMLPCSSVRTLFLERVQTSGSSAHISWQNWVSADGSIDMTRQFKFALDQMD